MQMILSYLEKAFKAKYSHKEKKLWDHIEECKSLTFKFLDFYRLNDYKEIIELLCYYHDSGKIKDDWNINNKDNPPHSSFSTFIFFNKEKSNLENYPFIPLFILRHHSILARIEDKDVLRVKNESPESDKKRIDDEITDWRRKLCKRTFQLDIKSKVDLVDAYGLFKFSDVLSANNLTNYEIMKPSKDVEELKTWLAQKIENKGLKLKKAILQNQLKLNGIKNNLLIRAPTGWGKTAASLSYAIGKNSKIIYVLPTITSIRSFYEDLCNFFGKENVGELFYYGDVEVLRREETFQELMFSSYLARPVTITTLDQLLLTFLQLGKYFMKRPHLRNSVIILDEIHTFSQNMLYILSFFIKKFLKIYDLKLCIMSATFPSVLKNFFSDLFDKKVEILWLNNEFRKKRRVMFSRVDEKMDILAIARNIVNLCNPKEKPFKIAIICNTIEKTQTVFKELQSFLERRGFEIEKCKSENQETIFLRFKYNNEYVNLDLLHSRFIYKHRNEKEYRIDNWLKTNQNFILVATQIIEVSLDVSFDFMITECAPLESLVQRFGRVNRYEDKTDNINVWITFPTEINSKKRYPYEREDILNTWKFLEELEGKKLKDELQLIEKYDNEAFLSETKREEIYKLLESWEDYTSFLYSWGTSDEFAQKLLKFREEFTTLVIPSIYEEEVKKLYEQMKKEVVYSERRKNFALIKEYTVPIPIWMIRISPERDFPIVDVAYDEIYGVRKEMEPII